MLRAGRAHRRSGADVVVAYLERRGRPATAAQLDDLDVLPARQVTYRGATFYDLDVSAVFDRCPAIALVDELAHANVPSDRHEKRWQDIEELLSGGIDVFTTLNVANIASLGELRLPDHRRARGRAGARRLRASWRDQVGRPSARRPP